MSNTSRYEYKLNYEDGKIKALYQTKNDYSNKGYFIFDVYTYGDDLLLIEMNLYDFYYLDDFLPSEFRCAIVNENYNDILDIIEIFDDFENGINIKKEYKPLRFPYFTKKEKMNNFSILLNTEDNIINLSICLKGTEKQKNLIIKYDLIDKKIVECSYNYSYSYDNNLWEQSLEQEDIDYILDNLYFPINYLSDSLFNYMNKKSNIVNIEIKKDDEIEISDDNSIINEIIKKNKEIIDKLMEENQELAKQLKIRIPILREELLEKINGSYSNCYIIKDKYKKALRNYDLSKISFDNVDIRGIDFRGTNINSSLLDLQKVYNKDASDCNFSTDEDNAKDYIFGYDTDFAGVNLSGTDMSNPYPILLNSTINKAYIDEFTILPGFYQDKVKKKSLW